MDRFDGEKKDVAGKGAWGDAVESGAAAVTEDAGVEKAVDENGNPIEEEKKEDEEPVEVQKTLEEYLAEKKKLGADAARKANEGSDDSQWKDAVVLKKEEEDFFVLNKVKNY